MYWSVHYADSISRDAMSNLFSKKPPRIYRLGFSANLAGETHQRSTFRKFFLLVLLRIYILYFYYIRLFSLFFFFSYPRRMIYARTDCQTSPVSPGSYTTVRTTRRVCFSPEAPPRDIVRPRDKNRTPFRAPPSSHPPTQPVARKTSNVYDGRRTPNFLDDNPFWKLELYSVLCGNAFNVRPRADFTPFRVPTILIYRRGLLCIIARGRENNYNFAPFFC